MRYRSLFVTPWTVARPAPWSLGSLPWSLCHLSDALPTTARSFTHLLSLPLSLCLPPPRASPPSPPLTPSPSPSLLQSNGANLPSPPAKQFHSQPDSLQIYFSPSKPTGQVSQVNTVPFLRGILLLVVTRYHFPIFLWLFLLPYLFKWWNMICMAFSGSTNGKESACQWRRCKTCGFDHWVGKTPWRRAWQPTPVSLPGESRGQRRLAGYSL